MEFQDAVHKPSPLDWTVWRGWSWTSRLTFLQLMSFPKINEDWFIFQVIDSAVKMLWFLTSSTVMQRVWGNFTLFSKSPIKYKRLIGLLSLTELFCSIHNFDFHREVVAGKEFDRSVWISNHRTGCRTDGANFNSQKYDLSQFLFELGHMTLFHDRTICSDAQVQFAVPRSCSLFLHKAPTPHLFVLADTNKLVSGSWRVV